VNAPALTERRAAVLTLPGVPRSAGQARAFVRGQLGDGQAAVVGELLVSELVTNAITHTRSGLPGGTFSVSVEPEDGGVLVTVTDAGATTAPAIASPASGTEHGRGVALVAALAAEWGTEACDGGRVTWCRIRSAS
jgi:anti-sigma regulatory factor (Ser/Thr protein kinase)